MTHDQRLHLCLTITETAARIAPHSEHGNDHSLSLEHVAIIDLLDRVIMLEQRISELESK